MVGKQEAGSVLMPPSVHGLEHGRHHARRRASRRRIKNTIVSGVMFAIAAGVVGTAGYYLWQFYVEEQNAPSDAPAVGDPTTDEIINRLEQSPRWNGPGAPAFGVGESETPAP